MTKKRLNLALIQNDTARKVCFKKRKSSLLKKVYELSTLCDVEAFMIICSPYESEPTVWPSHQEVQERLDKYRNRLETLHTKNIVNQEGYLRWGINKMKDHSKKQAALNKIMETQYLMYQVNQGSDEIEGLKLTEKYTALRILLEKMKAVRIRMNYLQGAPQPLLPSKSGLPIEVGTSQPRGNAIGAVNNIANNLLGRQGTTDMVNNNSNKNGMGLSRISITSHDPESDVRHQNNDGGSYVVNPSSIVGPQLSKQALVRDNRDENIYKPIWGPYGSISGNSIGLGLPSYCNVAGGYNDYYTIGSSWFPHSGNLGEGSTSGANMEQQLGFLRNERNVE